MYVDGMKNKHEECFTDFMLECKMFDNFTSKGTSDIDYNCVPQDRNGNCTTFQIHNTNDLISPFNLRGLIGNGCKLSDHTLNYRIIMACEPIIDGHDFSAVSDNASWQHHSVVKYVWKIKI